MRTTESFSNKRRVPHRRVCGLLLSVLAAGGLSVTSARAEEVQVVKSGKYYGAVQAYRIGDDYYLAAKEGARIYSGQLYWYAVSKTVRLSIRGRQIQFKADSKVVEMPGKSMRMSKPMIVRASQAFIPVSFFTSKNFSDIAGVDSKFNAKTRLLLVDHRSTVGPLRWFTYEDHTRVVLELSKDLKYQTSKRGAYGYMVSIPNGTIDWSERIEIEDGVIKHLHLHQDAKKARLSLMMADNSDGLRIREFKNPRRIVIDVARRAARRVAFEAPEPPPVVVRERLKKKRTTKKKAKVKRGSVPATAMSSTSGVYRIAIDAGHGGRDGGAVGRRGTLEKDINLQAAKELARLLRQEGLFDVKLIRSEDVFVRLRERSKLANKYGADLFISLHCNANSSRAESGYEIYFLSERASDPEAERLAEFENSVLALEGEEDMEDGATSVLYALAKTEFINEAAELAGLMTQSLAKRVDIANRGVKQAAFYVLRGANAPAVLVEMGFLSNSRDEAKLQSRKYRRKIVEGLYAGIIEFARRKDSTTRGGR